MKILCGVDPDAYSDIDEMVTDIKKRMRDKIRTSDLAEALYTLVSRKIDKVATYVRHVQE